MHVLQDANVSCCWVRFPLRRHGAQFTAAVMTNVPRSELGRQPANGATVLVPQPPGRENSRLGDDHFGCDLLGTTTFFIETVARFAENV